MDYHTKSREELISELQNQKLENDSFKLLYNKGIADRNQIEYSLNERLKELSCHDQIAEVMSNSAFSVDEVCEKIVQIIPPSWQFTEIAEASIQIYEKVFTTSNFVETKNSLKQEIITNQQIIGQIEVCYPIDKIGFDELAFLPEESNLLFSIAIKLGNYIGRKEKETALRQSEEKYKDLIENISDVIYTTDNQGNITFISPSITRLLGYLPEEIIGKNFSNFTRETAEHLKKRFEEIKDKSELQSEYQILSATGEPHWIRFSSKAFSKDGQFIGVTGTLVDITEKKLIELELQKSESLYRSILNASPDTIFIADLKGNVLFTSPMALKIFGFEDTGFPLNQSLFDFLDPKDHNKAKEAIGQMFAGIFGGATEYVGVKADGSTFDMEVNGEFIRDAEGNPTSMVFVVRDISERKMAENKLLKSEEQYRMLVESINDVIYEIDASGNIKFTSSSVINILGYTVEEVLGRNIFEFIFPEDVPAIMNSLKNLGSRDYSFMEYRYKRKDGSIRWVRSSTTANTKDGVMIGATGTLTDVTDRKIAEDKLRESEERFRMIFENVFDGISIFEEDPDPLKRKLIDCNEQYAVMAGRTREELLELGNIYTLTKTLDETANTQRIKGILEKLSYHGSFKWLRPDGKDNIIDYVAMPITWRGKNYSISIDRDITEYKQKEDQLRKLSRAIEQNPVSVVITDLDGNIEYANPKATETAGYSLEELKGKNPRVLKSGETPQDEYRYLWDSISHGNSWKGIFHNKRKNGELYWESSQITPILDAEGKIMNYLAIKEDITERKKIQEDLFISESRFREITEQSQNVIWETDSDAVYTFVSQASEIAWGLKPSDLVGKKRFFDIHPEEGKKEFTEACLKQIQNGQQFRNLESRVQGDDGKINWVMTNGMPYLDSEGNLKGYRGSSLNINLQKSAFEALRKSEDRFRQITEQSMTVIWEVDVNGRYTFVSPISKAVWGYKPDELVGRKYFYDLHPGEDREEYKESVLKSFAQKTIFKGIINQIVTANKKLIWVSTNGTPILDNQNNLIGYRGADNDITKKKMAEEALKESEEALNYAQQIANMGSWSLDLTNNKLTWSKNYYHLLGIDPEKQKVPNDHFVKMIHPDDAYKMDEKLQEIHRTKERASFDFRLVMPDGQIKWIQNNIVPVFEGDHLVSLNGVNIDITDKKLTEEALKINEDALNQAQEISKMCSWELDLINEKLTWSKNYYHLMGMPDGTEMKTEFFQERVHPDDLHVVEEKLEEMKVLKKPVIYDIRLRMPDNEYRWIQNNIVPEFENEILVRFKGVNIDVTEKKLAEESIKLQNERLSAIIGAMPDLIFVADKNGTYLEYYSPTPDMLTVPDDQIVGTNIKDIFDAETAQLHLRKIEECLQQQKLITYDFKGTERNSVQFFEIRLTPMGSGRVLTFVRDITNEKIKDNEIKKLSLAVEQSPIIIVITDLSGNIEYVNPTFTAITGYQYDEVLGQNTRILKSGETDPKVYESLWETINLGDDWYGEWVNKKKDGTLYWESVSITPIRDDIGKVTNYLAAKQDITLRKQTDDILKLSEEKYRYMFENNPQPMWIFDIKTLRFLEVNSAAISHYGYSRDEFLSMTIMDIRPVEDIDALIDVVKHSTKALSSAKEWRHKKKNGEIIFVEVGAHFITYNNIEAKHVLVNDITKRKKIEEEISNLNVNLEITIAERTSELSLANNYLKDEIEERKRIENVLSRSEKKYRTVVENLNEVIFQTDADGLWVFLNKSWEEVTGFSVKESLGQLFVNYVHPDDRAQNWELFEPLIQRKKEYCRHEIRYLTKDGGFRWIEVFAKLGLDENDQIIGTYGTLQDITERKQAEETVQIQKQRLESVIEGSSIGTWEWNVQTGELQINEMWAAQLGYTLEELSPTSIETWAKLMHPDDLLMNEKLIEKHLKGESEFYLSEDRMRHKNGDWKWIFSSGKVISRTDDGKPLWMFGSHTDITERKLAEDFENELLQLSPTLTGLSLNKINDAITQALSRIGQFLSADRSYIFEFYASESAMNNTHEWCNTGINPEIENLQGVPCEVFPHWMEALLRHENIVIPSVQDLPESWQAEREILEPQGIQSLIVMPLLAENTLIGFVGLDSVVETKEYTNSEINILKVWSSMLGSLINNQRSGKLLEQTRQNYETFFNTIDDFLWVLDEHGNIIHTNNTITKRLEYTTDELLSQSILMVHPADRREEAGRIVGEMLAGITEFCPVPVMTKSGKSIPVETKVKSGFWDGKEVIFGVSKDISQIKISEQKFASAFHSNSAVMTITRFDNDQFVDVNNAFINLLGYSREEIVGKTLSSLGIVEEIDETKRIQLLIEEGIPVKEMEINAYSKSNQLFIFLLSAEEIYVGLERCILSVAVNITERKIMENELRKAREEAEKANLAKSEFLSRMSHELRTPMNSILGFAQLLEMGELNSRQSKGVNHIMKSGKHLLDLINEVLDISRIEAGRLSLSLEPVQLSGVIPEMIDIVKLQIIERQIRIEVTKSESNQMFVRSDRQRLKQILLNLLNNAIKYNRESGSIWIKTELRPVNELGVAMIRISITDSGLGISEEDLPKLFTPFERIGAEKSVTEGTGLGLSVVKKLIEAMSGNLGVESQPGTGSTFWIELPNSKSPLEHIEKSGLSLNELEPKLTDLCGTILYIEDNASNIELVEQILTNQRPRIELIFNTNGKSTVDLAVKHKPNLILLDLNLPDIHGKDVLTLLQADKRTTDIPVIVISADAMPQQLQRLLKAGAKDYLTKPLDVQEFLTMIDKYIPHLM